MSYNPIIVWLLYSPLHWLMSGSAMAINYRGRKSGRAYRLPIGYKQINHTLLTISYKQRKWWRNMRGGTAVTIRLQGKDRQGRCEVIEDEQGVMEGLREFIGENHPSARMLGVKINAEGQVDIESLRQAARERVVVRTNLT